MAAPARDRGQQQQKLQTTKADCKWCVRARKGWHMRFTVFKRLHKLLLSPKQAIPNEWWLATNANPSCPASKDGSSCSSPAPSTWWIIYRQVLSSLLWNIQHKGCLEMVHPELLLRVVPFSLSDWVLTHTPRSLSQMSLKSAHSSHAGSA